MLELLLNETDLLDAALVMSELLLNETDLLDAAHLTAISDKLRSLFKATK